MPFWVFIVAYFYSAGIFTVLFIGASLREWNHIHGSKEPEFFIGILLGFIWPLTIVVLAIMRIGEYLKRDMDT